MFWTQVSHAKWCDVLHIKDDDANLNSTIIIMPLLYHMIHIQDPWHRLLNNTPYFEYQSVPCCTN